MYTFICGQDSFRSKRKLKELLTKLPSRTEIFSFDASFGGSAEEFILSTRGATLFGGMRALVIVYPVSGLAQQVEALAGKISLLAKSPEQYFVWEGAEARSSRTPKAAGGMNKWKKSAAGVFEFPLLDKAELKKYIKRLSEEVQAEVPEKDLELLVDVSGGDLWMVMNELEKLRLTGEMQIKKERLAEEKIFAFTDALASGEKHHAYRLFESMRIAGFDEFYLVGALAGVLRTMIKIKSILPTNPEYPAYEMFGLHPFVLKKTLSQVRRFRIEDLKRLYCAVLGCDIRLKSTTLEPETVFTALISEF